MTTLDQIVTLTAAPQAMFSLGISECIAKPSILSHVVLLKRRGQSSGPCWPGAVPPRLAYRVEHEHEREQIDEPYSSNSHRPRPPAC